MRPPVGDGRVFVTGHGTGTQQENAALGIIDSLSAGYRFLGRRVYLLLVPVALDLLLWLAPRLSIAPLLDRLAAAYDEMAALAFQSTGPAAAPGTADMAAMAQSTTVLLRELGAVMNLWSALVSGVLLHVPSLLATAALPPARGGLLEVESGWVALGIWLLLALVGLLLGVLYLELLARVLPLGASPKPASSGALLQAVLRHTGRVLGFVLLVGMGAALAMLPLTLIAGLLALVAPGVASGMMILMGGALFVLFVYLYFVTAAIVLDDLPVLGAMATSVRLVRTYFFPVLGFALLVTIISAGMGILLDRVAALQPVGTIGAILLNAYIGTGLSMALLVFYRSRLLRNEQAMEPQA